MTQLEFNKHAITFAAQVWVGICCIAIAIGTTGVFVYGIRWGNIIEQLKAV